MSVVNSTDWQKIRPSTDMYIVTHNGADRCEFRLNMLHNRFFQALCGQPNSLENTTNGVSIWFQRLLIDGSPCLVSLKFLSSHVIESDNNIFY